MKANELIKKYGIEEAKSHAKLLQEIQINGHHQEYIDDLKRLAESHDICEAVRATFGDYDKAFDHFTKYKVEFVRCTSYSLKLKILVISKPMLKKAIADVESCQ